MAQHTGVISSLFFLRLANGSCETHHPSPGELARPEPRQGPILDERSTRYPPLRHWLSGQAHR